ncbi:MAG TPA: M6 family metalloprotease domain-containing protein [Planctomycetaceae bacterium]|nr:M6 family metalloprotease domain-containing protein [Planctomycetaceae bacterium]
MRLRGFAYCAMTVGWLLMAGLSSRTFAAPPTQPMTDADSTVPTGNLVSNYTDRYLLRRSAELNPLGAPPEFPLEVVGSRTVPIICVEFPDQKHKVEVADLEERLFGAANKSSLSQYYRDMSRGKLTVTGKLVGWYAAPKKTTAYSCGTHRGACASLRPLIVHALDKADGELDFGQFDNDGRDGIPNSGDDDGRVDFVAIVHSESGQEVNPAAHFWSHKGFFSRLDASHAGPYRTKDARRFKQGNAPAGAETQIVIDDYTLQPSLSNKSTMQQPVTVEIGVFCHEFAHSFGLPDLYSQRGGGHGVGLWCGMSHGMYGGDHQHPDRPVALSPWCRYFLGWVEPRDLTIGELFQLPAARPGDVLRWKVPNTANHEYFLIEYRTNQPSAANKPPAWDEFLPGSGLAIWHIDERVGRLHPDGTVNSDWPFSFNNRGLNDDPVVLTDDPMTVFEKTHPLIALIQADQKMDLEKGMPGKLAEKEDLFLSGGKFEDDATGAAGSRSYDGKPTGFAIREIAVNHGTAKGKVFINGASTPPGPMVVMAPPAVAAAPPAAPPAVPDAVKNVLKDVEHKLGTRLERVDRSDLQTIETTAARLQSKSPLDATELSDAKRVVNRLFDENQLKTIQKHPATQSWTYSDGTQISSDIWKFADQAGAVNRTFAVGGDQPARNDLERALQAFRGSSSTPALVHYVAGENSINHISGLNLDAKMATRAEDARLLIHDKNLLKTLGLDANMFLSATDDPTALQQQFYQAVKLPTEQTVPIWGSDISFQYNAEGKLTDVSRTTLATSPSIAMPDDLVTTDRALKAAQEALGLGNVPAKGQPELGVYVPSLQSGGKNTTPYLSYRVLFNQGKDRDPRAVYIDGKTGKLLDIR